MTTLTDVVNAVRSHAAASGLFSAVNGHEPKSAPVAGSRLTCSVWLQRVRTVPGGLATTSAVLELNVRLYVPMLREPQDLIDPELLAAVDTLCEAYVGDLQLGVAGVRSVDVRGIEGAPLDAVAGYVAQDSQLFRVVTITLPIIVDDLWTEAP